MIKSKYSIKDCVDLEISYLPEYYRTNDTMMEFVKNYISGIIFDYKKRYPIDFVGDISNKLYDAIKNYHETHDNSLINITPNNILDIVETNNKFSIIKATLVSGERRYICRDVKCTLYISNSFSANSLFYNNEINDDIKKDIVEYVKTYNSISKPVNRITSYGYIPISITEYIGIGEYK